MIGKVSSLLMSWVEGFAAARPSIPDSHLLITSLIWWRSRIQDGYDDHDNDGQQSNVHTVAFEKLKLCFFFTYNAHSYPWLTLNDHFDDLMMIEMIINGQ